MRSSESEEKIQTKAKNAAYRLLAFRPHSRFELETKLRDREYPDDVIASVVADLARFGYVNDPEFARSWAASRIRLRGFGRRRIEQELRVRGIGSDVIRETLPDVFGEEPEIEIARRETEKKLKSLVRYDPEVRRRRLAGHLERKGFSAEIIHTLLREIPIFPER